ncbi:Vesicular, overexpressed in cancer, prosurvival protein 1 [Camponotus japonicus]
MIRYYECDFKNDSDVIEYACTSEYCLYCHNSQCCLILQRRPRHLWEIWYFWLGVVLLAVFLIFSVSSYLVSNHRHNIQGTIPIGQNAQNVDDNRRNDWESNQPRNNQDQISISVISSTFLPQRKMLIIDAQPNIMHMTPVVA